MADGEKESGGKLVEHLEALSLKASRSEGICRFFGRVSVAVMMLSPFPLSSRWMVSRRTAMMMIQQTTGMLWTVRCAEDWSV